MGLDKRSYMKSINADYIEEIYQHYLLNEDSVDESWKYFFDGLELGSERSPLDALKQTGMSAEWELEKKVFDLISAYRTQGYLTADLNPLDQPLNSHQTLSPQTYGISDSDLTKTVQVSKLLGFSESTTIQNIILKLKSTYSEKIGLQYTHITTREELLWVQTFIESGKLKSKIDPETKKWIYKRLSESECFEKFLHTRYVAQKRFSIEGGEALIPALDAVFEKCSTLGADEFVIGMAHRGRLNVLTNIMGKDAKYMFTEFEGKYAVDLSKGEGDVKYHKGASNDFSSRTGKEIHLSLTANPSHLEFVNPVVEGIVRAKQDLKNDTNRSKIIPIQIHGDAAFAGQGVCYETINLSQLSGYATGGTLHVIVNNQVGFTTSFYDSRSTRFCTDLALMLETPIIHVNGDDIESVVSVMNFASEYRQKFHKDIFIDLICYRKYGHNEGDEPSFTQPLMYAKIKTHQTPREIYGEKLISEGLYTSEAAEAVVNEIIEKLQSAQAIARAENQLQSISVFEKAWKGLQQPKKDEELFTNVKTSVESSQLKTLSKKLNTIPSDFKLHPKLSRFVEAREKAVEEGKGIDWGNAESLAYASLVTENHIVRVSGQDAERGTFTHRHAVFNDIETGKKLCPLNHLSENQARFFVHNSHLSETGVLGFEHGYSLASPNALTIWEAQFGDFANGAQVIIDQFISSSESKWLRMSGLTLLLPHGYEGQGPEHSSARLERFLQLCARNNMIIGNLTTPAQIFHALRRQVKLTFRKPLIIMSPKSLLRHQQAISTLDDLSNGKFEEILNDVSIKDSKKVKRVLLCSGKIYYELNTKRIELKNEEIAIVRLEQIYPLHETRLSEILNQYGNAKEIFWVQEEPRNMGAWGFIFQMWAGGLSNFSEKINKRAIRYVGREVAAAPAVGSPKIHEEQQKEIINKAFQ